MTAYISKYANGAAIDAALDKAGTAVQPANLAVPTGAGQANGLMTHQDKAKLNGIETGATADQTAQEIAVLIDADSTAETRLKSALGLGSAAYTASSAYATAAQGGKADTALQPGSVLFTSEVAFPASSSASGTKGAWAWNGVDLALCVATDTWVYWTPVRSF